MTKIKLGQFYPIKTDEIPVTWAVGYVGNYARLIQSGFACGKHGRDDGIAHLRPMNVSREGLLDLSDVKTVPPEFNDKRLNRGDVLFNNTNSPELVGKTAFVNDSGHQLAFSNHMTQVIPGTGISARFFAYQLHFLWYQRYFFHRCVKHVNQASISATELEQHIPFVCPPTNEQRRIVERIEAMFDEIDHGVENLKKAKTSLGLYRQSLLKSAFEGRLTADWRAQNTDKLESPDALLARIKKERDTRYESALKDWKNAVTAWKKGGEKGKKPAKPKRPVSVSAQYVLPESCPLFPEQWAASRLGDLNAFVFDGPFGSNLKTSDYTDSGIRVIRLENIGYGNFLEDKRSFVSEKKYETIKKHTVYPGTIVVSSFITDALRSCIVPSSISMAINKADCFAITLGGDATDVGFAAYYLQSVQAFHQLDDLIHGVGRPRINTGQLKEIHFPICSSAEQAEITRILDDRLSAADTLENEIDAGLARADALRQSILKQAFSGKLVPQDPNDEPASVLLERIKAEKTKAPKARRKRKATA